MSGKRRSQHGGLSGKAGVSINQPHCQHSPHHVRKKANGGNGSYDQYAVWVNQLSEATE